MNKVGILLLLIVLGLGGYYFVSNNQNTAMMGEDGTMMEDKVTGDEAMMEDGDEAMMGDEEKMMEDDGMMSDGGEYKDYSASAFAADSSKKRVYYFHADWCPTCRPLDAELSTRESEIPDGVVIYKTDYDTEDELKDEFGVTYQHTFVQVDEDGNEVMKWNGGDMDELLSRIN